jgi:hypothetical protein
LILRIAALWNALPSSARRRTNDQASTSVLNSPSASSVWIWSKSSDPLGASKFVYHFINPDCKTLEIDTKRSVFGIGNHLMQHSSRATLTPIARFCFDELGDFHAWLAKFFGLKKPQTAKPKVSPSDPIIEVREFARPKKAETPSEPRGVSAARAAAPALGIDGWVGWNFCAQVDVQGVQHYRDAAKRAVLQLKKGDLVELVRAPNSFDENAIEVRVDGTRIGFLARDIAELAAERISPNTPIQAEYSSGYLSNSGFVRVTIQPLVPDSASRKRNGWTMAAR